jgi:hypothetical protein
VRFVVLGLLTVTLCRAGGELPVLGQRPALSYQPGPRLTAPPGRPVAEVLAAMSWAEKANARLQFVVDTPEAREAEALWSSGDWDRALALIRMLEPEEYAVAWREPVPVPESDWGTDVLVSARDSVVEVELDVHRGTGNLFCVIRYLGDGVNTSWAVNMSTDRGATWAETFRWGAGYEFGNLGAVCQGDYVYIGFPRGFDLRQAFLYRCRASDGQQEDFPGGREWLMLDSLLGPTGITEVEIWSNADSVGGDNQLYYAFLHTGAVMRAWWIDMESLVPTQYLTEISDIDRGLDLTWNQPPALHYLLFSGIGPGNEIRLYGAPADGNPMLDILFNDFWPSNGDYTGVSGWHDTIVICLDGESARRQAQFLFNFEGGAGHWYWGAFGDTAGTTTHSADVCGRLGDGQGAAFWQSPQEEWGISYTWRSYGGPWSPHVRIQDPDVNTYATVVPDIRHIGPSAWGVVFTEDTAGGRVLFDRTDSTGVSEPRTPASRPHDRDASIAAGTYRLPGSEPARLFDRLGRQVGLLEPGENDFSGLQPGVYFIRTEGSGLCTVRRITVVE